MASTCRSRHSQALIRVCLLGCVKAAQRCKAVQYKAASVLQRCEAETKARHTSAGVRAYATSFMSAGKRAACWPLVTPVSSAHSHQGSDGLRGKQGCDRAGLHGKYSKLAASWQAAKPGRPSRLACTTADMTGMSRVRTGGDAAHGGAQLSDGIGDVVHGHVVGGLQLGIVVQECPDGACVVGLRARSPRQRPAAAQEAACLSRERNVQACSMTKPAAAKSSPQQPQCRKRLAGRSHS